MLNFVRKISIFWHALIYPVHFGACMHSLVYLIGNILLKGGKNTYLFSLMSNSISEILILLVCESIVMYT